MFVVRKKINTIFSLNKTGRSKMYVNRLSDVSLGHGFRARYLRMDHLNTPILIRGRHGRFSHGDGFYRVLAWAKMGPLRRPMHLRGAGVDGFGYMQRFRYG